MDYTQIKPNKNASLLRIIFGTLDDQRLKFVSKDSVYYLPHKPHRFEIVGSCNGIICLLVDKIRFLLWNPSTRQAKRTTKILKNQRAWNCMYQVHQMAFGFDSLSNDYKVIRFLGPFTRRRPFITPIFNADNFVPVLQLYSANTDAWKEIQVQYFPWIVRDEASSVMCNDNLHWIAHNCDCNDLVVLSFNIEKYWKR